MKKKAYLSIVLAIFLAMPTAQALFGHGPVPGVDIPIDPGAFWDPDRPDYADDGNVYTMRQLRKGTVYDHRRNVENIPITEKFLSEVTNEQAQIANQRLDLTPMSDAALDAHAETVNTEMSFMQTVFGQLRGLMSSRAWSEVYPSFLSYYEHDSADVKHSKDLENATDKTYQDSLKVIKNSADSQNDLQAIMWILNENKKVVGNKHAEQLVANNLSLKTAQSIPQMQNWAIIFSAFAAAEEKKAQKDWEDRKNTYNQISTGSVDPYNPTTKDNENYTRPKGQGFLRF